VPSAEIRHPAAAVYAYGSAMTLTNNIFSGNSAVSYFHDSYGQVGKAETEGCQGIQHAPGILRMGPDKDIDISGVAGRSMEGQAYPPTITYSTLCSFNNASRSLKSGCNSSVLTAENLDCLDALGRCASEPEG
jgi:hypothetical protein